MSSKKGSKGGNIHPGRNKKRRFSGNRYTASVKKLKDGMDIVVPGTSSFGYCILEFTSVFSAISASVICKKCKSDVSFTQSSLQSLGFKII